MTIDFDVNGRRLVASSLHDADADDRLTEPFRMMLESVGCTAGMIDGRVSYGRVPATDPE